MDNKHKLAVNTRRLALIMLGLASYGLSFAQSDTVLNRLKAIEQTPLLAKGMVGYSVIDQETGEVLIDYNGGKSFMPASNLKVVTTATALSLLGDDYKYTTRGYYSGRPDSVGILKGNLYIVGSGDPSMGSDQLAGPSLRETMKQWTETLLKQGVKVIQGDLYIDPFAYDRNSVPDFWPWADLGNYYGAGVHGINVADNTLKLYFRQNREEGSRVKLSRIDPSIPGIDYDNQVTTGPQGSGDEAYIYGGPYQTNRMILGTLPPGDGEYKIKGSIPDPPLWFGHLLKQVLKTQGITIKGTIKTKSLEGQLSNAKEWFVYQSPALSELIRITNFYSINLYAESLLQQIALEQKGKGKRELALQAVKKFWSSVGMDTLGWLYMDGSGLSPLNAISPQQLTFMLKYMANHERLSSVFYRSLPQAGKEGTVYWFGKNTALQNNARLKSGSFTSVLCYSGYLTTRSNRKVVFSIMLNRYEGEMRTAARELQAVLEKTIAAY